MLGAQMRVEAEGHLQLINGLSRDAGGENLMQPLERVVITFQSGHTGFDRQSRLRGLFHRANARQAGKVPIRVIGLHGNSAVYPAVEKMRLQRSAEQTAATSLNPA